MSFKHIIPGTINQFKPPALPVPQVKTEALMAIKNEPLDSEMIEIGVDDILDSSDILDIKDIDIVYNSLCEDSIKSETVPENTFERKHWDSVETQVSKQTGKTPFIKTENISQNETLSKTEDISDGNENRGTFQGAIAIQGSLDQFNSVGTNKQSLNHSRGISARSRKAKHSKTTASWRKDKAPLILFEKNGFFTSLFSCDRCHFKTRYHATWKKHNIIHLKPEECQYFYCFHCSFKSKHKSSLQTHIFRRHFKNVEIEQKQKRHSCDQCGFTTYTHARLNVHKLIHLKPEEGQYFYCDHCSYKSRHKHHLKKHIFTLHNKNVKRFRCDHCDYKTRYSSDLKKHNIIHLKPEEGQYFYCDYCSYKSRHKPHVQRHIFTLHNKNVESKQKRFRCDHCDYKTQRRDVLKRHNLIHLKPEESQYFYCDHCSFKSRNKQNVKQHIFTLHNKNVERFRCDHCDYKTRYSSHLKKHNIIHLKPEEGQYFYCDHCSYKSRHKPHVQRHIFTLHNKNVESKQKRFRCDHCDYKTQRRDDLKRHNIIHLKPEEVQYFYCSHCSFKCKHKSNLRNHILRHFQNEEVKFCCYICDFMTLERELIIYHIKTHSKVRNKSKINEGD